MTSRTIKAIGFGLVCSAFFLLETSCGRRVVHAPAQPTNINIGAAAAPAQHVPTSRKEIRILKKARKSGVY